MVTIDEVLERVADDAVLGPAAHELAVARTMPRVRRFGSEALRASGTIFAMVVRERLVVKLPPERVRELLEAGKAGPFETRPGRGMKQWAVVLTAPATWRALMRESHAFVAGGGGASPAPAPKKRAAKRMATTGRTRLPR